MLHFCSLMMQNQQDFETILEFKTAIKVTMGNKSMLLAELIFVLLLLFFLFVFFVVVFLFVLYFLFFLLHVDLQYARLS